MTPCTYPVARSSSVPSAPGLAGASAVVGQRAGGILWVAGHVGCASAASAVAWANDDGMGRMVHKP